MDRSPRFCFSPMDEASARAILGWQYSEPYSFYNNPPEHADVEELLDGTHFTARGPVLGAGNHSADVAGFFAFGASAQVPGGHSAGAYYEDMLDIGLGLRPDLTGRGIGLAFVEAGLAHGRELYHPRAFRLSVATFNQRAIRVYERAGFKPNVTFTSPTPNGEAEFLLMTKGE